MLKAKLDQLQAKKDSGQIYEPPPPPPPKTKTGKRESPANNCNHAIYAMQRYEGIYFNRCTHQGGGICPSPMTLVGLARCVKMSALNSCTQLRWSRSALCLPRLWRLWQPLPCRPSRSCLSPWAWSTSTARLSRRRAFHFRYFFFARGQLGCNTVQFVQRVLDMRETASMKPLRKHTIIDYVHTQKMYMHVRNARPA